MDEISFSIYESLNLTVPENKSQIHAILTSLLLWLTVENYNLSGQQDSRLAICSFGPVNHICSHYIVIFWSVKQNTLKLPIIPVFFQ